MNGRFLVSLGIGAVVGMAHASALWRSTQRPSESVWGVAGRLPLVAVTLVIAALIGRFLPVTVGWAVGLSVTGVVLGSHRWK